MSIMYMPKASEILYCDFEDGGSYQPPEMRKRRRVVVISHKRHNYKLVVVVPISGTKPQGKEQIRSSVSLSSDNYIILDKDCWAKSEFLCTVSRERLEKVEKRGKTLDCYMNDDDYEKVLNAVDRRINLSTSLSLTKKALVLT